MNYNKSRTENLSTQSKKNFEYSFILKSFNFDYEIDEYYYLVGGEPSNDDRNIFITCVSVDVHRLYEEIMPFLKQTGLSFQIVKNRTIADWVVNGLLGDYYTGKLLILFVPVTVDFNIYLQQLIAITKGFFGPTLLLEKKISGVIYCGTKDKNRLEARKILINKYFIIKKIKNHPKGNLYEGLYLTRYFRIKKCIIKQGRKYMVYDNSNKDMTDRVVWQFFLHNVLHGIINIPKAIALIEKNADKYLVIEYLHAVELERVIDQIYKGRIWTQISKIEKLKLLELLLNVLDIVDSIHKKGFIHRDLTASNFMVKKKNQLYIIDFEMAFNVKHNYPLPPFGLGTKGYMSPEQEKQSLPTVKEDIYALGALMIYFFCGIPPLKFDLRNLNHTRLGIHHITNDPKITNVILNAINIQPNERLDLKQMKTNVQSWYKSCKQESL